MTIQQGGRHPGVGAMAPDAVEQEARRLGARHEHDHNIDTSKRSDAVPQCFSRFPWVAHLAAHVEEQLRGAAWGGE